MEFLNFFFIKLNNMNINIIFFYPVLFPIAIAMDDWLILPEMFELVPTIIFELFISPAVILVPGVFELVDEPDDPDDDDDEDPGTDTVIFKNGLISFQNIPSTPLVYKRW